MTSYIVEYLSPAWTERTGRETWIAVAGGPFDSYAEAARHMEWAEGVLAFPLRVTPKEGKL